MSEVTAETIQYRIPGATIDDNLAILPRVLFRASFDLVSSPIITLNLLYSKLKEKGITITNNLVQDNAIYIDMLKPPEIAESFHAKLHADFEIGVHLEKNRYLNYTLNSIFSIINETLKDPGFGYRIDLRLRDKGNRNGWERIDLVIKFPEDHYEEIKEYWKDISIKVGGFYGSLNCNPAFSEEHINQMRQFIYIVVRSEDW
ncbi:MAG TPA: hypothetical protein VMY43_12230 [Methanothrix sp.]|nr:hypothetical protein [Methanothrix sp.]